MWKKIAAIVLRNRTYFLVGVLIFVALCIGIVANQGVKFSTSNAQLLPSSSPVMQQFNGFLETFGQEDNTIVIGFQDDKINQNDAFLKWKALTQKIQELPGIQGIFSISDAQKLERDTVNTGFQTLPILPSVTSQADWLELNKEIKQFPFYDRFLLNGETGALQTVVYLKPEVVDSKLREQIVFDIYAAVKEFEQETGIELYLSGMPVIRTMNAQMVKKESIYFILAALFVTCFIFFLFYRSVKATLVSMLVVMSAVVLCFAMMACLGFEVTLLTALVPPLLIVIGIPNCIFLINKYQSEYKKHQNKVKALQRMIMHIGNAAMLTNFTTAFGFMTFVFTESETLQEFGVVASLNILGIFVLSFLIIPTAFSYFKPPTAKHLKHFRIRWMNHVLNYMENWVLNHRKAVYVASGVVLLLSVIGISLMQRSGNLLDDMSKDADFYKDISFFDQEFGGVIPLEIMVDTQRPNGVTSVNTLNKINDLALYIDNLNSSSRPIAVTELVKFAKQAYYNNDSAFYQLPTQQERAFILKEVKNSKGDANLLKNYVDSTQSKARMTVLLKNMESKEMEGVIANIQSRMQQMFPQDQYETYVTGAAYVFMKGTTYLTKNLLISLSLAIVLIALFMAFMFRSPQMILIALIPNFLPLLATAGLMGYLGIPIKPSTILVFSIAFGIAVDDTIHFLAKYRQELKFFKGNIRKSVELALDEVGNSMFYTSVVLFAGFSVFMFSGFMGIVALGGLVSFTLLMAMLSNLILLPSLLLSYEQLTTKDFIEPEVDYFDEEEEDDWQTTELIDAEQSDER